MSTHLLIPADFINGAIAHYKFRQSQLEIDDFENFNMWSAKINMLEFVWLNASHIDLHFDIEEKVKALTDSHDLNGWEQNGARHAYEEILKELL